MNDIAVFDAATGEQIATVPEAGEAGVDRAVSAARGAFPGWSGRTPRERSEALLEIAAALRSHRDELVEIEVRNTGRPIAAAHEELAHAADAFAYFAGAARNLGGVAAMEYLQGRTSFIRKEAVGVCGQIIPWNYPLIMLALAVAPALAAGNASILKPSEVTPMSALRVVELCRGILPDGVLQFVTGTGRVTGDALAAHPGVDLVSLIGSRRAGVEIAERSAPGMKRLHLELGGKAPVLVFDGTDVERVARCLRVASFNNAGQDCTAAARVIVAEPLFEEMQAALVREAESLSVGSPGDGAEMGPLMSREHLERVEAVVERARASGAAVLTGGERLDRPGYFYRPTVITGVAQSDEIVQKEVFGPVVTVQAFAGEDEGIAMANDVEYDLASSAWSPDSAQLFRAAHALNFGTVWMNDHFPMANEMPHGGFRHSGHGKDQSMFSLESYTRVKHLMLNVEREEGR